MLKINGAIEGSRSPDVFVQDYGPFRTGVRTFPYRSTDLSVQEYGCFHTEIQTFSYSYPRIRNIYIANFYLLMADFIDFFYVINPYIENLSNVPVSITI